MDTKRSEHADKIIALYIIVIKTFIQLIGQNSIKFIFSPNYKELTKTITAELDVQLH